MTTEEKARQIYNITYKQCVEEGYLEIVSKACAIMSQTGAEIMAEWKEQQMIDKACEWLEKHVEDFMPPTNSLHDYNIGELIHFFKKAMEE